MRWVDMRKGVAYLFRYRDVSLAANSRYLTALGEVDNLTDAIGTLDRITTRKQLAHGMTRNFSAKNGECTDKRFILLASSLVRRAVVST